MLSKKSKTTDAHSCTGNFSLFQRFKFILIQHYSKYPSGARFPCQKLHLFLFFFNLIVLVLCFIISTSHLTAVLFFLSFVTRYFQKGIWRMKVIQSQPTSHRLTHFFKCIYEVKIMFKCTLGQDCYQEVTSAYKS